MRVLAIAVIIALIAAACGGDDASSTHSGPAGSAQAEAAKPADDGKGVGEIKQVTLNNPLDQAMIEKGKGIYELKCAACHKLTDQRVVGPGWKGITDRRKPEWILNMITNVDMMLAEDAAAQKLLEECLTRMPNQNVTQEDARDILEFMYANDGK